MKFVSIYLNLIFLTEAQKSIKTVENPQCQTGEVGALGPSGPCSLPPLLRRQSGAGAVGWPLAVPLVTPEHGGGHQH